MKDNNIFQNLKLRVGYGETGNQEFVSDASLDVFRWTSFGNYTQIHSGNRALIWETVKSYNVGLDFSILNGRVYGSVDYFHKTTEDPVILQVASQPQPPGSGGAAYKNINGAKVLNYGIEANIGIDAITSTDLTWQINLNGTFLKNKFDYPQAGEFPLILTGGLHGQGTSNAFAQAIAHDQPINVYYLNNFQDSFSGRAWFFWQQTVQQHTHECAEHLKHRWWT
jgi:iron complex outermembrane receptor protein